MKTKQLHTSLTDLLFFPVTLPFKGFLFVVETLKDVVDEELYDEQSLYRQLMEVELSLEMGDITPEEYQGRYDDLMARIRYVQSLRQAEAAAADPAAGPDSDPNGGDDT